MIFSIIVFSLLALVLHLLDVWLYRCVVIKHGSQWQHWPGSGYYLTWKYRRQ